ncbi:MAG: Stp1/IreP family PP2C-type Ser/Thr phosphatase [Myxococcota bacterium]
MSSSSGETEDAEVLFASKTDVGRVRQANEDSFGTWRLDDGAYLLVVADGMGGHRGGATASQTAIQAISDTFETGSTGRAADTLEKAVAAANERVWGLAQEDAALEGMGTTVVAFHLDSRGRGTVAHVGDSRAYRYRNGRLEPLTADHSVVAEMQRRGLLSADEAAVHPRRNEILRSVGVLPDVEVDVADVQVLGGDRYILCSDGLSGVVRDEEIAAVIDTKSPGAAVHELIDLANKRGGPDNITVQILAVPADASEGDPEATAPVELTRVGIEAIETRRRRRHRARQIGVVVGIAAAVFVAYLVWQAIESPEPNSDTPRPVIGTSPAPIAPGAPQDRFEVDEPVPRKGIPRDAATR